MLVTRRQGIHSTCSSPYRPRSACSGRGLACTGSGFHPHAARPYHAVHQHERCESAGSRIGFSHCTPRRHIGAGEARDWPHRPVRGSHPDRGTPEALDCVGVLPGIPSSEPVTQGVAETESQPFPRATGPNLRWGQIPASAVLSSDSRGLCVCLWKRLRALFGSLHECFHAMWSCA